MPRTQRLKINDETTVYHVMSRTALDGFPIGDFEKDFMLDLIRNYAELYLVEIYVRETSSPEGGSGFPFTRLNKI